jgi:hypothetical protein
MIILLALACATTDNVSDVDTDEGSSWTIVPPSPIGGSIGTTSDDCDDAEYSDGLTLVGLPVRSTVMVSIVFGDDILVETIASDSCGVATPFREVALEDFGGLNEISVVYALVVEEPGYYVYQGVFLTAEANAPPETPVSTQWEWSDEAEDWVAIRDSGLGILIGIFMIP